MQRSLPLSCLLLGFLLLLASMSRSQETITEPSTEKSFPASVTFTLEGKEYALHATGTAVRKKLLFKVYGMVHYMQDPVPGPKETLFKEILTDGKAKQITMNFAREVTPKQITDAYRDGFKENATKEELASVQPVLEKFLGYFTQPVKENDLFTLRWVPGGKIVPIIQGKEHEALVNPTFARILWSIWFGPESIVDRDDLVAKLEGK
jgi:hypothetical protein